MNHVWMPDSKATVLLHCPPPGFGLAGFFHMPIKCWLSSAPTSKPMGAMPQSLIGMGRPVKINPHLIRASTMWIGIAHDNPNWAKSV